MQTPSLSPTSYIRQLSLIFSIGITLGSGLGYGLSQTITIPHPQPQCQISTHSIGLAEYERLQPGMTLVEAESILDRGREISRSATSATFRWANPDGSYLKATFVHNKLASKEQSNLK